MTQTSETKFFQMKMGALYINSVVQKNPENPVWDGDIPRYDGRSEISISDAPASNPETLITWTAVEGFEGKTVLIADRVILNNVSWEDLAKAGFARGNEIKLGGKPYRCSLMPLGRTRGANNIWNLSLRNTNRSNSLWHWEDIGFWGANDSGTVDRHVIRGNTTPCHFSYGKSQDRSPHIGFRPMLEPLYAEQKIADDPESETVTPDIPAPKIEICTFAIEKVKMLLREKYKIKDGFRFFLDGRWYEVREKSGTFHRLNGKVWHKAKNPEKILKMLEDPNTNISFIAHGDQMYFRDGNKWELVSNAAEILRALESGSDIAEPRLSIDDLPLFGKALCKVLNVIPGEKFMYATRTCMIREDGFIYVQSKDEWVKVNKSATLYNILSSSRNLDSLGKEKRAINYRGMTVGGFTLEYPLKNRAANRSVIWRAKCVKCGRERNLRSDQIVAGSIPTCVCMRREFKANVVSR